MLRMLLSSIRYLMKKSQVSTVMGGMRWLAAGATTQVAVKTADVTREGNHVRAASHNNYGTVLIPFWLNRHLHLQPICPNSLLFQRWTECQKCHHLALHTNTCIIIIASQERSLRLPQIQAQFHAPLKMMFCSLSSSPVFTMTNSALLKHS